MRKENSIRNAIVSIVLNIVTILVGFIAQAIFIKILGIEYLGVNGLFNNIISMLSLVELGIGPAIIYNLYRPVAYGEKEKVKSLLNLYKKSYNIVAFIVVILGIIGIPFLHFFVKANINFDIKIIFILFIFDSACSYLFTYKRSILYAEQKNYIINIVHIFYMVLLNAFQILILILTKNYILYICIRIVMRLIENIILSKIADKKYPYIVEKNIDKLENSIKKDIFKKVKGMMFHKIGSVVVLGTDNIIISSFLGISIVGLYSNYLMIINALSTLLSQMFSSITASVGNLLVKESVEHSHKTFKKLMFANFWIFGFSTTCFYLLIDPFITIWIGEQYLLSNIVVLMLSINFYMFGMRSSIGIYKDASGIYWEDRYIPIIECVINIIMSIIFVKYFGLFGVFFGTFLSSLIVTFFSLPYFVYRSIFKRKMSEYILQYIKYILIVSIGVLITYSICNVIKVNNEFLKLIIYLLICIIIPNLLYFLFFNKSEEYRYFLDSLRSIFIKFNKNIKNKINN